MELEEKILNNLRLNGNLSSLMIAKQIKLDHGATCELLKKMHENKKIFTTDTLVHWKVTENGLSLVNEVFKDQTIDLIFFNDSETEKKDYHIVASNLRKINFGYENLVKDADICLLSVEQYVTNCRKNILFVEAIPASRDEPNQSTAIPPSKSNQDFDIEVQSKHFETGCLNFVTQIKMEVGRYLIQLGFDENRDFNIVEFYLSQNNIKEKYPLETLNKQNYDSSDNLNININNVCPNFLGETNKKTLLCDHLVGFLLQTLNSIHDSQLSSFQSYKAFSFSNIFSDLEKNLDSVECHSVEAVIIEKEISFGELLSMVLNVFSYVGLNTIAIKPLKVNTLKPNVNLLCYHEELDEWIQVGSCGMIHPDQLKHTKLSSNMGAFIISLEAIIMIKCGIISDKEIVGSLINLEQLKSSPIFVK